MPKIPGSRDTDDAAAPRAATAPEPLTNGYDPRSALYADSADRLVRQLFDVGLRLHGLREVFEDDDALSERNRRAGDAVADILEDLDKIIRNTGLTMLAAVSSGHSATADARRLATGSGRPVIKRMNRR
ncbi:hypothetical protein [Nocardia sp. NPDC052566]|uniref:hypothetical protein n=1 Tax=Nocardia sp. NPDC052566 TaxID=3364330 RepID=UPI0037C507E3